MKARRQYLMQEYGKNRMKPKALSHYSVDAALKVVLPQNPSDHFLAAKDVCQR